MFSPGIFELSIIALIVVVLFGKRLPALGDGLGKAISNFRKSYKDAEAIDVTPKEDTNDADSADSKE